MIGRRSLLRGGVLAPILFVLVFLINDALKPGYEPVRDYVSEAAIGPGGWVQIANFAGAGLLITASSFGLSRTVSRWTGRLIRVFGVCLIAAGVFVSDPVPHDRSTWHGSVHNAVSIVAFGSLTLACCTASRWRPTSRWRWLCILTGCAIPVLFVVAGGVSETAGLWQRLTIAIGWSWLAVLGLRALHR
ncbi:DUF998 domain-containing protein [Nucisporomicrobium flavum]|uniref:DUF998 domain-containing protein n=1 Tax=Nucisporomicrobium flavum TaxID=2785915 RepID=UPI003C30C5B1